MTQRLATIHPLPTDGRTDVRTTDRQQIRRQQHGHISETVRDTAKIAINH